MTNLDEAEDRVVAALAGVALVGVDRADVGQVDVDPAVPAAEAPGAAHAAAPTVGTTTVDFEITNLHQWLRTRWVLPKARPPRRPSVNPDWALTGSRCHLVASDRANRSALMKKALDPMELHGILSGVPSASPSGAQN